MYIIRDAAQKKPQLPPIASIVRVSSEIARTHETNKLPQDIKQLHERDSKQSNHKRVKVSDKFYEKAHSELESGDIIKAFHLFRKAAELGSETAKRWIYVKESNTITPHCIIIGTYNINQTLILQKFSHILNQLQQMNAYNESTISDIMKDLTMGHCLGFSIFYAQLSLEKALPSFKDLTHTYYLFSQKLLSWTGDVFEPPPEFSYHKYVAGDRQGLTPDQERDLELTHSVTRYIQMLRFAQQNFSEADEWQKPVTHQDDLNTKGLLTDIPLRSQQDIQGILGSHYVVPMKISEFASLKQRVRLFISSLKANLRENNAALLTFPASDTSSYRSHAVTILLRDGLYYMFDSNDQSNELNYDPTYSATYYLDLEALFNEIGNRYNNDIIKFYLGGSSLTFIELRHTNNIYVPTTDLHTYLLINKLSDFYQKFGDFLFNQFFPISSTFINLTPEILQEIHEREINIHVLLQHEAFRLSRVNMIDCSLVTLDTATYIALILALPIAFIQTKDYQALTEAYYRIGRERQG